MDVRAPSLGDRLLRLEWRVQEGELVSAGQVLAFVDVPGECALPELRAPSSGRLTARWAEFAPASADELVAVIDDAPGRCRASELISLARHRAGLLSALGLIPHDARGAGLALLTAERRAVETELATVDARIDVLRGWLSSGVPERRLG